jgi:hypothetical protein
MAVRAATSAGENCGHRRPVGPDPPDLESLDPASHYAGEVLNLNSIRQDQGEEMWKPTNGEIDLWGRTGWRGEKMRGLIPKFGSRPASDRSDVKYYFR